jgi:hypothetical protein
MGDAQRLLAPRRFMVRIGRETPGWGPATLPPWEASPLFLLVAVPLHVRLMSLEKLSITEHSMLDRQSHCFAERDVQTFLSLSISLFLAEGIGCGGFPFFPFPVHPFSSFSRLPESVFRALPGNRSFQPDQQRPDYAACL